MLSSTATRAHAALGANGFGFRDSLGRPRSKVRRALIVAPTAQLTRRIGSKSIVVMTTVPSGPYLFVFA